MKLITSARNEQLKHVSKLLSHGKARRAHGQTVLEGVHLLQACLQAGVRPIQVYVPEHKRCAGEAGALLAQLPEHCVTPVAAGVLSRISGLAQAEEVLTLIDIPAPPARPRQGDCVVLDCVQDPGNVGTIMRSAAAAGVQKLVLGQGCADAWAPKVLRAGMGAHFLLDVSECVDLAQWCAGYGGSIWATALSATNGRNLYDTDLTRPAAWVFGNEGGGVSAGLLARATGCVNIPMAGATESLNVAMAATVCLFEQMRQRR
ncbi:MULTISPECIES: RNA methyltransferase [unclassified Neisseria]|uniref:TrmH family RNA methyltransferase n=1 Tax=unclassified Neisseria TaxID=2623750 RepID=UPI0010725C19|nr:MULTISPECIES: RNA methyltransferase [unclassified Neisseria]MBF0804807.1 RNA methyltransferase [Neisseria sp. 19428wB4_WF04]TFU39500.1 RNA methyltransferase [Neisseria sp. WF04]